MDDTVNTVADVVALIDSALPIINGDDADLYSLDHWPGFWDDVGAYLDSLGEGEKWDQAGGGVRRIRYIATDRDGNADYRTPRMQVHRQVRDRMVAVRKLLAGDSPSADAKEPAVEARAIAYYLEQVKTRPPTEIRKADIAKAIDCHPKTLAPSNAPTLQALISAHASRGGGSSVRRGFVNAESGNIEVAE